MLSAIGFQTIVVVGAIVALTQGPALIRSPVAIQFIRKIAALSSVAKATQTA